MNNEKEVRNFYNEEEEYEKSILVTKELISNIIKYNETKIKDKLKFLQKEKEFEEYVDLLTAVIGKKTNKYYYCEDIEDVKYYQLEVGKVYKMTRLNVDIQSKNCTKKQLNLHARALLAEKLLIMTEELKKYF